MSNDLNIYIISSEFSFGYNYLYASFNSSKLIF